jgi:hypothetical protein
VFVCFACVDVRAQAAAPLTASVACPAYVPGCDEAFFQEQVPFVRFVRDQSDAEVFVLITSQETGGGGRRYTLFVQGQRGRAPGVRDTLFAEAGEGASEDVQRQALVLPLALGLAHVAARADLAAGLRVAYAPPAPPPNGTAASTRDPWNAWVFRVSGYGYAQGQRSYTSLNTNGSFSASRVTDTWKLTVRPFASYNRSTFTLSDGEPVVSTTSSGGAFAAATRALGPRLSGQLSATARRSTFDNIAFSGEAGPAIEVNLYPYTESTRRQLRLQYRVAGAAVAYVDTTIFGRLDELLLRHEGGATAVFAQPWGSTNIGVELSHYLSRPDKYRASLFGDGSIRVAKGLNLNGFISFAFVRDQLSLPLGGATDEEILTRQRLLATNFEYFGQLGLTYTFGSVYNPTINARFGS